MPRSVKISKIEVVTLMWDLGKTELEIKESWEEILN